MLIRATLFATQLAIGTVLADECKLPAHANHLRFEDFPAQSVTIKRPVNPRLLSDEAKMYRTRIREGAKESPSFAGNIIVTGWGCGTNCGQSAFIDAESGHVWVAPFIETSPFDSQYLFDEIGTYYCLASKLYVIVGSINDSDVEGIYYYRWTGKNLELLKTVELGRHKRGGQN